MAAMIAPATPSIARRPGWPGLPSRPAVCTAESPASTRGLHRALLLGGGPEIFGVGAGGRVAGGTPVSADPDPRRARDAVRSAVAAGLAGPTGSIHIEPLGIAGEVKRLLAAAGSVERFAADLPHRWIDQLVIAGDLTHCADRIASLAGQGIDHVILSFPAGITPGRQDTVSRQLIAAVASRLP
jgi:hypothetical protein